MMLCALIMDLRKTFTFDEPMTSSVGRAAQSSRLNWAKIPFDHITDIGTEPTRREEGRPSLSPHDHHPASHNPHGVRLRCGRITGKREAMLKDAAARSRLLGSAALSRSSRSKFPRRAFLANFRIANDLSRRSLNTRAFLGTIRSLSALLPVACDSGTTFTDRYYNRSEMRDC